MATWPSESTLFNTSITGADANPLMKTWLETNKQLVGAVAPVTLRIGNGSITPTAANILVDTEGGAAADTLSVIATSKMHDGAIILLRSADSSRKVTVQHSTGTGGLATVDAKNITLDTEWPLLACLVGDRWQEIPGARRAYDKALDAQKAIVPPDGVTIKILNGKLSILPASIIEDMMSYKIGQYEFFEDEALRPGWLPCLAGVVENFSQKYPKGAAYFETPEGKKRLVTQAQYNALHVATWHTNADGSKVGWQGIGGVNKFVWDRAADTLKLPDLTDMFRKQIGGDAPNAGDVHGDGTRNVEGQVSISPGAGQAWLEPFVTGAFTTTGASYTGSNIQSTSTRSQAITALLRTALVVPTAAKNQPRAWGALACVYLGQPAS